MDAGNACELVPVAVAIHHITNMLSIWIVIWFEPYSPNSSKFDHRTKAMARITYKFFGTFFTKGVGTRISLVNHLNLLPALRVQQVILCSLDVLT